MNDLDLCLEVVLRSCQPLRHIHRWISRKPLQIEAWFQRSSNSKWPMGYQMVTWPMTARDPERSNSLLNTLSVQYLDNSWWGCYIQQQSLTLVLQVGGGVIYPQTRFSHHCTKTAYNFLNASVTFRRYILATEPPNFLWETKGSTPDVEKLISSVSRVRHAADGKIWRVHPCFHVQSSQWLQW